MRAKTLLVVLALLGACDGDDDTDTIVPADGAPAPPDGTIVDAGPHPRDPRPDGSPGDGTLPTAAACDHDLDCKGGTCLGRPGGIAWDNPNFAGGYCTSLLCTAESQEGCGPDEWCTSGGDINYCVELCSKAEGMTCSREDHVCLGLGTWGGCYSEEAVECSASQHTGCEVGEICARVGFEDKDLGRCETLCDPMNDTCGDGRGCYYIRRYNTAFCNTAGTTPPDTACTCDKCCTPGYACTPDLDGAGKHCKPVCTLADGCADGQCVALEDGSPWGGCALPGSPGTP